MNFGIPHTNGNNKHSMDCVGCKTRLSFTMPKSDVVNTPKFSTVVSVHERVEKCSKCGQCYSFFIEAIKTSWGMAPISEEQRRQIEGSNIIKL